MRSSFEFKSLLAHGNLLLRAQTTLMDGLGARLHFTAFLLPRHHAYQRLRVLLTWSHVLLLSFHTYFIPSQSMRLLAFIDPYKLSCKSSWFYPPHCYQLSQAEIYSLLWNHLTPCTTSVNLESPLDLTLPPRTDEQGIPSYCTDSL